MSAEESLKLIITTVIFILGICFFLVAILFFLGYNFWHELLLISYIEFVLIVFRLYAFEEGTR